MITYIISIIVLLGIGILARYLYNKYSQDKLNQKPLFTQLPEYAILENENKIALLHRLLKDMIIQNKTPDIQGNLKRIFIHLTPIVLLLEISGKVDRDKITSISKMLADGYVMQPKAVMLELEDITKNIIDNIPTGDM